MSGFLVDLPVIRQLVHRQQGKLIEKIKKDIAAKAVQHNGTPAVKELPNTGMSPEFVRQRLQEKVSV